MVVMNRTFLKITWCCLEMVGLLVEWKNSIKMLVGIKWNLIIYVDFIYRENFVQNILFLFVLIFPIHFN